MGALSGIRIVELAAIGPTPFCGMLLADMGAEVLRIDRREPVDLGVPIDRRVELLLRGRRTIAVDLKKPAGVALVLDLVARADALIEGFRPGVTERLGVGPAECLARNPRLVYGRMTGWGQDGPLASAVGHDIDYIALAGVLDAVGPAGAPVPPLNLIADYGGGGAYLAIGVLAGIISARTTGAGQVVDAAMIDGAASLLTSVFAQMANGTWNDERGTNILDGGAPWYSVYETADQKHIAIGALERRFYAELLRRLEITDHRTDDQYDRARWPALRERLASIFRSRTRDEWSALLEGSDVCFAPVLSTKEAMAHPHNRARGTFVEIDGVPQPAPAPRFSRTPSRAGRVTTTADTTALMEWGVDPALIDAARRAGAIAD